MLIRRPNPDPDPVPLTLTLFQQHADTEVRGRLRAMMQRPGLGSELGLGLGKRGLARKPNEGVCSGMRDNGVWRAIL